MTKKEYVISEANNHIYDVPGFPKPGIIFKDITPVFEDAKYAEATVDVMLEELMAKGIEFDKIIAPESRGFLFGAPLAIKSGKGLVLARKPGKLPRPGVSAEYDLEYGKATVYISEGSVKPGERVIVVDDLLATGGSANACAHLVEKSGGVVVGCAFYLELTPLKGRDNIPYPVVSLIEVEAY